MALPSLTLEIYISPKEDFVQEEKGLHIRQSVPIKLTAFGVAQHRVQETIRAIRREVGEANYKYDSQTAIGWTVAIVFAPPATAETMSRRVNSVIRVHASGSHL